MQEGGQEKQKQRFLSESIDFNYKMLVSVCKFTTLYMLQKYNEREFLFEDPLERQYRVQINKQITCTCHEGNLGHCIHSLYILTRIYKLPENHPLIFKNSYTEEDLKLMKELGKLPVFQGKKRVERVEVGDGMDGVDRLREHMKELELKPNEEKKEDKGKKDKGKKEKEKEEREWPVFQADTVCSICYDQIQNQTPIIDCLHCRNYFHTKCLTIWMAQKQKQQSVQSCPMCRSPLEPTIPQRILQMQKYYIQYHQSHGIACSSCHQDILIKLYKCLLCEELYLCEGCYMKWEHKSHDRFIWRDGKRADWAACARSQFNINKLNANLEYMRKMGLKSNEVKVLMGDKYEKFMSDYIKKPSLLDHIINSLVDVQKQVHKTYKKLDFTEKDIVCCMCKKKKILGMRRLSCRHFIDEKCLRFILENSVRQCPLDKKYILPGLSGVDVKLE